MADHKGFISYSQPDTEWARSFAAALQQQGIPVWFDQFEIAPGESLRDALESGLRESDVFVTVVNPESPVRPAVLFELVSMHVISNQPACSRREIVAQLA